MSSETVAQAYPLLFALYHGSRKTFATILTDSKLWKKVLQALIEIAYNCLYKDVGLSKSESKEIFKHRKFLDQLAGRGGRKSTKSLFRKRNLLLKNCNGVKALAAPINGNGSLSYLTRTTTAATK